MKKRIIALLLVIATVLGAFAGCTVSGGDSNAEKYGNRPRKIVFSYFYGGYGEQHWIDLAADYMENYEEDVYVEVNPDYDSTTMRTKIQAGTQNADVAELAVDMFFRSSQLEDLTEVYNSNALGENVRIKDKNAERYSYYLEEYKDATTGDKKTGIFQFPDSNLGGYHFAYNVNTLDEVFGKDNYKLPNTTNEFFAFGDAMYDNGAYLSSAAVSDKGGGDYLEYCYQIWFAQLMGKSDYDHFYAGEYYDVASNGWKLNDNVEATGIKVLSDNEKEIKDAYTICKTFLSKENTYMHPATSDLDYLKNDKVFAGIGDGMDTEKTGFLFIGSWFENEIAELVENGTIPEQTYGMMRVPVASSLVKYLEYRNGSDYMTDAMLSAIIDTIDAGKNYEQTKTAASASALSENDYNRIYEARKMSINQICSEIVVPKMKTDDPQKKADIFKFLTYLATDRAQEVAAKATGGLNMTAFGKSVDEASLGINVTKFVKDCNAIASDSIVVDYAHIYSLFKKNVTVKWYYVPGGSRLSQYLCTSKNTQTADAMYTQLYANLRGSWQTDINMYKIAAGLN